MKEILRILKALFKYIFTISDEVKKIDTVEHDMKIQILYRIILLLFLAFVVFISYGYISSGGLNFKTISQFIMFLILCRIIIKEHTDHIFYLLFNKKSYKTPQLSDEEKLFIDRRNKLIKIKKQIKNNSIRFKYI